MIIEFSVKNFRSINELQTISFVATGLTSLDPDLDKRNIVQIEGMRLLKVVGVYGANASGKSNVLKALHEFRHAIVTQVRPTSHLASLCKPFYYQNNPEDTECYFQIIIIAEGKKYRYGFTVMKNHVASEWLYGPANENQTFYFLRKGINDIQINEAFFEEGKSVPSIEHNHALFLSHVASFKKGIAFSIWEHIQFIFDDVLHGHKGLRYGTLLIVESDKPRLLNFLSSFQLTYSDIQTEKPEKYLENRNMKIFLKKNNDITGISKEFDLDEDESAGTQKLFDIAGRLIVAFTIGGALILDELDGNFHPRLVLRLIELFNNPEINTGNAQLIFTSHDTNLMSPKIMRRDQFYFTEKDEVDATRLYSLSDLKGIRNDADFARQYLAGFYGAVPILGSYLEKINSEK